MKKLFRVIFYIPKLLLQFIWNLIWAIFKLALVLALIGYGLVYYANNSSSTLATNINQAFHQVELGLVVPVLVTLRKLSLTCQRQILFLSLMELDGRKIQLASIYNLQMKPW